MRARFLDALRETKMALRGTGLELTIRHEPVFDAFEIDGEYAGEWPESERMGATRRDTGKRWYACTVPLRAWGSGYAPEEALRELRRRL